MKLLFNGFLIICLLASIAENDDSDVDDDGDEETTEMISFLMVDHVDKGSYVFKNGERKRLEMWRGAQSGSTIVRFGLLLDHYDDSTVTFHAITITGKIPNNSEYFVVELTESTDDGSRTILIVSVRFTYEKKPVRVIKLNQYHKRENHLKEENWINLPNRLIPGSNFQLTILIDYRFQMLRILDNNVEIGWLKSEPEYFPSIGLEKMIGIYDGVSVENIILYEMSDLEYATGALFFPGRDNGLEMYANSMDIKHDRRLMSYVDLKDWYFEDNKQTNLPLDIGFLSNFGVHAHFIPKYAPEERYIIELHDINDRIVFHVNVKAYWEQVAVNEQDHDGQWMREETVTFAGGIHWNVPTDITILRRGNKYLMKVLLDFLEEGIFDHLEVDGRGHFTRKIIAENNDADKWFVTRNMHGVYESWEQQLPLAWSPLMEYLLAKKNSNLVGLTIPGLINLSGNEIHTFREYSPFGQLNYIYNWTILDKQNMLKVNQIKTILLPSYDVRKIAVVRRSENLLQVDWRGQDKLDQLFWKNEEALEPIPLKSPCTNFRQFRKQTYIKLSFSACTTNMEISMNEEHEGQIIDKSHTTNSFSHGQSFNLMIIMNSSILE
uniref:Galectin domain-containing protein n=1 Tax=Romanomermis culicivorax TaxID=13658 RepID=A0A915JVL9_ROMCU